MTNLSKQIYAYSLGTYSFLSDTEYKIFKRKQNLEGYKKRLTKMKKDLKKSGLTKKQLKEERRKINDEIKEVNIVIEELKIELDKEFDNHTGIRTLRKEELKSNNVIGLFDSVLIRTLQMKIDEISNDIVVIQSYHPKVLKELIENGFYHIDNEKFIYFSSSAGQIRQKKGVWIRETLWDKYKDTLTCGLSVEDINAKGGCNINKYLSYKSLINSASEEWIGFDIDKCIVVEDLELEVEGEVDFINRETYEINRETMNVPIIATDGVGMMLPSVSDKNFMCRLPWLKGLLAVYDFTKHGNTKVTDIDGVEHDIIEKDIQIIFTKSQWKMHSYYESWVDYKKKFKEHKCQAAKLNEEEDEFNEGKLSYQMFQSLTNVEDSELEEIAASSINDISLMGNDVDTQLKVLGATKSNERKGLLQQALMIYPELLMDSHSKSVISTKKKAMVNDARTGKLNVQGSFTFVIPDLYSFCEYLFNGEVKSLLEEDEVYYRKHDAGKVAILRSPHLYREWGLKDNVINETISERFITDAIYVSNESLLSKLIQNDWDGDKVLVLSEHKDKILLQVAERNMLNDKIVPLYYQMEKAKPQIIDSKNKSIYEGLNAAFETNGAIGEYSNSVTKVWNSDKVDLDIVRILCMEANFEIDFAKTLFRLKRPEEIDVIVKQYVYGNLPHFFKYDSRKIKKTKGKVTKRPRVKNINNSTVNRLEGIIKSKRITFKEFGKFDYKVLMNKKKITLDQELVEQIIKKYTELDQSKKDYIKQSQTDGNKKGRLYIYKHIRQELLKIHNKAWEVTDVLIEYLYGEKDSKFKDTLWESFGDIIVRNLKLNIHGIKECKECGKGIEKVKAKQFCADCAKERELLRVKKFRSKKVNENKIG